MKNKIVLAFACSIAIASTAHAQIKKGSVLLGGSFGIGTEKTKYENSGIEPANSKNNSYSISPSAGKAVRDNLVLGIGLHYIYKENENMEQSFNHGHIVGAGVFLRQYWEVLKRFYLFGEGQLGGFYAKEKTTAPDNFESNSKSYLIEFGITPGISFAVSNKVHLESSFMNLLSARYVHSKVENKAGSGITRNTFNLNGNLDNPSRLTLGVRFLLSKS